MVDEVDRQIQIKQRLDEHKAGREGDFSDIDTPVLKPKEKPPEPPEWQEEATKKPDISITSVSNVGPEHTHSIKDKIEHLSEDIHTKHTIKEKVLVVQEVVHEIKEEAHIKENIYRYEAAIAGGGAGSISRICTQPFDVLKIRFQLQVEEIHKQNPGAKYKGLWQAFLQIVKDEGVLALWKGHSPAQFLSTSYGVLQWVTYEVTTRETWNYSPTLRKEAYQPAIHFVCGGIAGCVGTLGSSPFDVIRTRLVGQGKPEVYRNLWHAAYLMTRDEGITTFYKGLVPALLQIAPYSGMQFMAYSALTKQWKVRREKHEKESSKITWLSSLLCGMIAGLFAKSIIYPLDVVKKRLQVQGFGSARKQFGKTARYTGLINCVQIMIRDEGVYSLYKGLAASCLKAATTTGCNFMVYEQIVNFLHFVESDKFWFDF